MVDGYYEVEADEENFIVLHEGRGKGFAAHYHKSVELYLCEEGEVTAYGDGKANKLRAGDVFFANSFVVHGYSAGEFFYRTLIFPQSIMRAFEKTFGGTLPMFAHLDMNDDRELFEYVDRAAKNWKEYNNFMKHATVEWVLGYLGSRVKAVSTERRKEGEFIVSILQYVDDRYMEELTAQKVAKEFGYSPNYFSALFSRFMRVGFHDYLNSVRLRKMEELRSADPEVSIGKAAQWCGFSTPHAYYRACKRIK